MFVFLCRLVLLTIGSQAASMMLSSQQVLNKYLLDEELLTDLP